MIETINKMNRISRQILQETGAEPDPATLAIKMEMPEDKIRKIMKVTTATVVQVKSGNEIVSCEQCGRILYWAE